MKLETILFEKNLAIEIKINESKTKEYQQFSPQSETNLNNKGTLGFVLTAIKINNLEN